MSSEFSLSFQYANGQPDQSGIIKACPEDFFVAEELSFDPCGEGEHVYWYIEKKGLSTPELINEITTRCKINKRLISYAGLKDKHACTRQWVSLHVGLHENPQVALLNNERIQVLKETRHNRKLKRGGHRGNFFRIRLSDLSCSVDVLQSRLSLIEAHGVPNYFGSQRFGNDGDNVIQAERMFLTTGGPKVTKFLSGILLSSARSWLFNHLLSSRVQDNNWNRYIEGDVMALDGSAASFKSEPDDALLSERVSSFDIHPSGPLWGKGELQTEGKALEYEAVLANYSTLCSGLEERGMKQERRALRLKPQDLNFTVGESNNREELVLEFRLGKGAYATTVLRELVELR